MPAVARAIVVKKASRTAAAEQVASPGKEKSQSRERSKRPDVDVDDDAAGRHDGQGKPREGEGWGRSGFCLHPQPAATAPRRRRTHRCLGGQDAVGLEAQREMGNGVVWRWRRLVFLLWRLWRPRQADLRARPHSSPYRGSPVGMGKDSRGVDIQSVDDLDERQAASWMKQASANPGFGGKRR